MCFNGTPLVHVKILVKFKFFLNRLQGKFVLVIFSSNWRRVAVSLYLTKSGFQVFLLTRFHQDLKLFFFLFFISNDSLILHLWYCSPIGNVFRFIHSSCPWHSRQCSVMLGIVRFKFLCQCSMVLVRTFFVNSP